MKSVELSLKTDMLSICLLCPIAVFQQRFQVPVKIWWWYSWKVLFMQDLDIISNLINMFNLHTQDSFNYWYQINTPCSLKIMLFCIFTRSYIQTMARWLVWTTQVFSVTAPTPHFVWCSKNLSRSCPMSAILPVPHWRYVTTMCFSGLSFWSSQRLARVWTYSVLFLWHLGAHMRYKLCFVSPHEIGIEICIYWFILKSITTGHWDSDVPEQWVPTS